MGLIENLGAVASSYMDEKEKLEKVLGEVVDSSRQHFLKLDVPKTYNALINSGFRNDYTMGFAEHSGFRSGTARTHLWFDLLKVIHFL